MDAFKEAGMATGEGSIVVDAGHSPLSFILYLTKVTVVIDGQPEVGAWGVRSRAVAAGSHTLNVSFRYLGRDCGKAEQVVDVAPGTTATFRYRAPWVVFSPGKMTRTS